MSAAVDNLALLHLQRRPEEAARILEGQAPTDAAAVLQRAPVQSAAKALACLAPRLAAVCFERFPPETRRLLLEALPAPTAAAVLRLLPQADREGALDELPGGVQAPIQRALRYPSQSAGALADPHEETFYGDLTVKQAIDRLRASSEPVPASIFVLDRSRRVVGAVTPAKLLCADRGAAIAALRLDAVRPAPANVSVATLASDARYERGPAAVTDSSGTFVGALGERVLRDAAKRKPSTTGMHLAASLGELYWLGLCAMLSGFSARSRTAAPAREG